MRTALAVSAVLALALSSLPAAAQARRNGGLVIDVKPRSWLMPGTAVPVGRGLDYVSNTATFGGGPVNGISSRGESNLPDRGGRPLFTFDFLGANAR